MKTISKKLQKKIIDMLTDLSKNAEKYKDFWRHYSKNIKMGILDDEANREKLAKLLRFRSSKNTTSLVSFEEYIGKIS